MAAPAALLIRLWGTDGHRLDVEVVPADDPRLASPAEADESPGEDEEAAE